MSKRSGKSEYIILVVLIIGALAFVIISSLKNKYQKESFVRTTLSVSPDGLLMSYVLFERLELSVTRSYDMLMKGMMEEEIGVVFLINPLMHLNGGEIRYLKEWISHGGILICTSDCTELLEHLGAGEVVGFHYMPFAFSEQSVSREARPVSDDWQELPLARDVDEVLFLTSNAFDKTRLYNQGFEPLFADTAGVRIMTRGIGAGEVIVLADSSFMANGMIGESDNAILAVDLASYAAANLQEGTIAFDEYHFGNTGRKSSFGALAVMLSKSSIGWAIYALTAAGLLYMYAHGRQFGTRRAPADMRRRSKMEFIESVGSTYRVSGANRLTFKLLYNWFRRKCALSVGLPESVGGDVLSRRLSFKTGTCESVYAEIFKRCDEALSKGKISRRRLFELEKSLRKIEEEIS